MTMPTESLNGPKPPAADYTHPAFAEVKAALEIFHVDLADQCHAIDRLHALVKRGLRKDILVIEGPGGVGKSHIVNVAQGIIRSKEVAPLSVNVCRVELTGDTGASVLGELICRELKVPASGLGYPARLGKYVQTQLKNRDRRMLVIDNSHLLVRDGHVDRGTLQILGSVVASRAASVVLVGRQGTRSVGYRLRQAVGQTWEIIPIGPLSYETAADLQLIKAFLGLLAEGLAAPLAGSGVELKLHTDDIAKRLWAGSWGNQDLMITLIVETLRSVLERSALPPSTYRVTKDDFAEAWRTFAAHETPLTFNPFTRHDPPTLGDIEQARIQLKEKERDKITLPKAPRGDGARIWS